MMEKLILDCFTRLNVKMNKVAEDLMHGQHVDSLQMTQHIHYFTGHHT